MNKIAIVTGGAGFVGSHLVDSILEKYSKIYIIDNLVRTKTTRNINHLLENKKIRFIKQSADLKTLFGLCIETNLGLNEDITKNISAIYHLAATRINRFSQRPIEGNNYNTVSGFEVINFAKTWNIPIYIASSASVYNNIKTLPITEDINLNPKTLYGISKLYLEQTANILLQKNNFSISRFFSVYGPRMDCEGVYTEVIFNWLNAIKNGNTEILVYGDPNKKILDLVYVSDVVDAINTMFSNRSGEAYNVGFGKPTTLSEVISTIEEITKTNLTIITKPENRSDVESVRYADITKLRNIGWKPKISLAEGILKTWNWIKML